MENFEDKEIESKFIEEYNKWIKLKHPKLSNEIISTVAIAYINFFKHLRTLEQNEVIDVIKKFKDNDTWDLTSKEEILLDILATCEKSNEYKERDLVMLNAFLLKKENIGLEKYTFKNHLDLNNGKLIFHSEDMERDLYLLDQNKLIEIQISSTPKVAILSEGVKLLKSNITYYVFREQYDKIVLKDMDEFYKKSPFEREQLYSKILLFN